MGWGLLFPVGGVVIFWLFVPIINGVKQVRRRRRGGGFRGEGGRVNLIRNAEGHSEGDADDGYDGDLELDEDVVNFNNLVGLEHGVRGENNGSCEEDLDGLNVYSRGPQDASSYGVVGHHPAPPHDGRSELERAVVDEEEDYNRLSLEDSTDVEGMKFNLAIEEDE